MQEGRRQYVVSILRQSGEPIHLDALARTLGDISHEPVPEKALRSRKVFHDSFYRRLITDDIRAINLDERFGGVFIRSSARGVCLCSRDDLLQRAEARKKAAKKLLWETNVMLRKASMQYQIKIEEEDIGA